MKQLLVIVIALLWAMTLSSAQEATAPQDGVALTVYNQGTALVQDRRTFLLNAGETLLNFTDVASTIDATSVSFKSLTDPDGTSVIEQNYAYDLVDTAALLQRYLDETIQVTAQDGTVYRGQLLSGRNGDIILRADTGEISVINVSQARDVRFPELPEGLITRPTLRWLIQSLSGGEQQVELTYLAGGMSWTADYILLLANDNASLDLNGWVTLTNTSGTSYQDAKLKLVAGDVNRIDPYKDVYAEADGVMAMRAAPAPSGVEERDFFEYKLYEITRPVTIGNNETKQVEFVSGANVPATTFYVYDASPTYYNYGYALSDQYYGQTGMTTVSNFLEFTTGEDGGLGANLPAGRVRVYQEDVDGAALLIGENTINHTPKGETVQLYLGNAFDLVGERVQTNFLMTAPNVLQETYQITLRNRKENESVEVRVVEHLFRWSNWRILLSNAEYTQKDSNTIEYRVTIPAKGEVVIDYTVEYSFPR